MLSDPKRKGSTVKMRPVLLFWCIPIPSSHVDLRVFFNGLRHRILYAGFLYLPAQQIGATRQSVKCIREFLDLIASTADSIADVGRSFVFKFLSEEEFVLSEENSSTRMQAFRSEKCCRSSANTNTIDRIITARLPVDSGCGPTNILQRWRQRTSAASRFERFERTSDVLRYTVQVP